MSDKELIRVAAQPASGEMQQTTLTRADWLEVAIAIFKSQGVEAVRVTRMAQDLGVTRGGFYWHFSGRDDLLQGLIAYWKQKNARSFVLALDQIDDLHEGILSLFSVWLDPDSYDSDLDQAMRDWARKDTLVQQAVNQADKKSLAEITAFFMRMGIPKIEATARARTVYFCQIGYYALGLNESIADRLQYSEDTVYILSGKRLSPKDAKTFKQRMLAANK